LRQADSAARCGGDEFVILLPDTDAAGARHVAERVRRSLVEGGLTLACGNACGVSASIGIAQWSEGWTVEQWLEAADQAMYASKRSGRNPG
jgi:diguanylate cyclase (GGDEF)-like protein